MSSPPKYFAQARRLPPAAWFTLVFLAGTLVFIGFYLFHSRSYLSEWFHGLHPCFYRNESWDQNFFNEATKAKGNWCCMIGIGCIASTAILLWKCPAPATPANRAMPKLTGPDWLCLLVLGAGSCWLWRFAHHHILPYMDEVFSAIHCVELHPFQTASYYMLPNNHILYNLLNNLIFHAAADHLVTGRILSGLFFYTLLALLYLWLRQMLQHRLVSLIVTFAVALHFQVWGFAAMNRGYELYLLCQWASFICLLQYYRSPSSFWLRLLSVSMIAGFTTLPTFLYFGFALIVFIALQMAYRRKVDWLLLRYALLTAMLVFLCYLPALCFSGAGAFVADEHIKGANMGYAVFLLPLLTRMRELLEYCFTGYFTVAEDVYLLLAAMPLLAFIWFRRRERILPVLFWLALWLTTFLFSLATRQLPFARNLIGHFSFTYAFILLSACWIIQDLLALLRLRRMLVAGALLIAVPFAYHFIKLSRERLALALYHFDINTYGRLLALDLRDLPPGADVGYSDESFYLLYLSRQRGFHTASCSSGQAEYYIRIDGEPLPTPPSGHYQLMWERGDYRIYQRKP